mgnify:CR=1 FL=1
MYLQGAMTSAEISDLLGLNRVKDHQWHIQSCCALTGEGYVLKSAVLLNYSLQKLTQIVISLNTGMDWVTQNVHRK